MTFPQLKKPDVSDSPYIPYPIVKGLDYEYPAPDAVVGSALELNESTPKAFQPLKIRNIVTPNRIGVSPMCQYTAHNEEITEYHKTHYGGLAMRGPGLIIVEVSGVSPQSGTSIVDLGIWNDTQAVKMKSMVDYAHANTALIGIQIGHAGRKIGQAPLFQYLEKMDPRADLSKIVGPSAVNYRPNGRLHTPRALTVQEIQTIVKEFGAAAKRAHEIAGYDFVEIHAAHGYLINEFMSAHSNKRTDQYGGSFENRIRFLLEVIDSVRANVPKDFPVFLRISSSELHDSNPDAWTIKDSVKLAPIVIERGIDVIDVSAGANDSNADRPPKEFGPFVEFAAEIKKAIGNKGLVAGVNKLHDPKKVNQLLEDGVFDIALVGSPFLLNPGLVFEWAKQLDVEIHGIKSHWPLRPNYKEMIEYIQSTLKIE